MADTMLQKLCKQIQHYRLWAVPLQSVESRLGRTGEKWIGQQGNWREAGPLGFRLLRSISSLAWPSWGTARSLTTLIVVLCFGDHRTKEMLGVVGSKLVWPVSNFAQQLPTTYNNMQQDVQTDVKCDIQQCWEMLANNVRLPFKTRRKLAD